MREIHAVDAAIVIAYFGVLLYLGQRAARKVDSEESFFLAGRRLGRAYPFFLNFGNATDANTAVSTVSLVYREGIAGVWLALHMIFINPYYWFMSTWFRRARMITMADLFEERLGSRGLARLYAFFQVSVGVVLIGFGNFTAYKISAALVPGLRPAPFYLVYVGAVGAYIVLGGMAATAVCEVFQGILILVFSVLLIPSGIQSVGGLAGLRAKVAPEMFSLFGAAGNAQFTLPAVLAILFVSLIQINANISNMPVYGSARDEFATRLGAVAGTYGKRIMIIIWGFVGLIALALFQGEARLTDPDSAWGLMSRQLFKPGLLGLMLAGVLAASTSAIAVKSLAVSALFVRNLFGGGGGKPGRSGAWAGRAGLVGVLAASIGASLAMDNVVEVMKFILTINLSFGAAVLLIFFWRRVSAPAVWWCVLLSLLIMVAIPFSVHWGRGRFNFEAWMLVRMGWLAGGAPASARLTAQFLFDGLFPFAVLFAASLATRPPERERIEQFFGRMKTPVGPTPELDAAEIAATVRDPRRFDHLKLFPGSSWEFTKWDRVDTVGFLACCAATGAILGLFWIALRLVA